MKKCTAVWLIIAIVLILVGGILFGGALVMQKEKYGTLSTVNYIANTYEVQEAFQDIAVEALTADVEFVPATDGKVTVSCEEMENCRHSVTVEAGKLRIQAVDRREWYDHIGISFTKPAITVALPEGECGAVQINTKTGDVHLPAELKAESVEISVSTGDVYLSGTVQHFVRISGSTGNITVENASMKLMHLKTTTGKIRLRGIRCEDRINAELTTGGVEMTDIESYGLVAKGGTGRMEFTDIRCDCFESYGTTGKAVLQNVVAPEMFAVTRTTGDIKIEKCDGIDSFTLETSTGDIKGSLLSGKKFYAKSQTGKVDVPLGGVTNGSCSVVTSTGNIQLIIEE